MQEKVIIVNVFDIIAGDSAISQNEGITLFQKIEKFFYFNRSVLLDFQPIDLVTVSFLNAAIGQLYSKYISEYLQKNLQIENIKPDDARVFIKVIDNAKRYFSLL